MCGCLLAVFISYENLCFPFWLVFGLRSWVNIPMPHPLPALQALLIFWAPTWGRQQFHAPLASDSVTITIAEAVRGAVTVPYTGLIMQMPHKTWPQLRSHFQDPTVITISSLYFFFVFFFLVLYGFSVAAAISRFPLAAHEATTTMEVQLFQLAMRPALVLSWPKTPRPADLLQLRFSSRSARGVAPVRTAGKSF